MLLNDVTKILKVLLASFQVVASPDELTQRRIGQIGEVIGAVDDVSATEAEANSTIADKRVEEAHDIIHRVAAILAMEEGQGTEAGDDGGGGGDVTNAATDAITGQNGDEPLTEVHWDGKPLEGETFELTDAEEE